VGAAVTRRQADRVRELLPRLEHALTVPKQYFTLTKTETREVAVALREALKMPALEEELPKAAE